MQIRTESTFENICRWTYPSISGTSLSNCLTAANLASGVEGGPPLDIGKPIAMQRTNTSMKIDSRHQCWRRNRTPEKRKKYENWWVKLWGKFRAKLICISLPLLLTTCFVGKQLFLKMFYYFLLSSSSKLLGNLNFFKELLW